MVMDLIKLLTIIIAIAIIYKVLVRGKQENMSTGWFPYGYLDNIKQGIEEGRDLDKVMGRKENFNPLTYIMDKILPAKEESQPEMVKELQNGGFDPNKYHIGEYSQNEIKPSPESINNLEDIQIGSLEASEFGTFEPTMTYADLLEVKPDDAGSGDLSDLKTSYKNFNGNLYFNTLDMLNQRGGNAASKEE